MITKHMSNHIHKNSPFQTDNTCKNCNKEGCDSCKPYFTINGNGPFNSYEEAENSIKNTKVK